MESRGEAGRPATGTEAYRRLSIDLEALLVDRPVVPATEECEVRERGGAALSPRTDVMALPEADAAAREAATAVPMLERPA